ncbi:hypothetical protein KR49_00100 [Synechococcus sp. KORDI-49]|nr:hypothetical protein KR49_00100 [Synechococcus sp. KORDI-49]
MLFKIRGVIDDNLIINYLEMVVIGITIAFNKGEYM